MPDKLAVAAIVAVIVGFVTFAGLSIAADEDRKLTEDDIEEVDDRLLRGETLETGQPWYYDHPFLAGIGTGVVVFLAGSLVVIAINSERRD